MGDRGIHKDDNGILFIYSEREVRVLSHVSHDGGRADILPRALAEAEWSEIQPGPAGVRHGGAVQPPASAATWLCSKRYGSPDMPRSGAIPKLGSYRQKLWMREKGDVPFWGS